ncbi:MAG: hypothetical protein J4G13_09590 [Dehalococcoidia bacterium]|nr:hypothetical protein [Dehalococcoidia bacterium]
MFALPPPGDDTSQDRIRLADWIEINLLSREEEIMSVDSVTAELSGDPPDDADDSEFRSPSEDPANPNGQLRPGFWIVSEDSTVDAFGELSRRAGWLRDQYPVNVGHDSAQLNDSAASQDIYRFLVLLRARQLYPNALEDDGEVSGLLFEELTKWAFGAYVGARPDSQVRFGVAGGSRGDGLPQPLAQAVQELGRRTREPTGQVPTAGVGDYKADAVVWKPFGDQVPGQLALIGQATITEGDWEEEEIPARWTDRNPRQSRLINWRARPVTAVAFPETLDLTPRARLEGMQMPGIPFDRLRLLSVLDGQIFPPQLTEQMRQWGDDMVNRIPK